MRWFGTAPNIFNVREQTLYNNMFVFRLFLICPAERERSILLVKICIYFIKLLFLFYQYFKSTIYITRIRQLRDTHEVVEVGGVEHLWG